MSFVTINPLSGEIIQVHHYQQTEETTSILQMLFRNQKKWAKYPLQLRINILNQMAKTLRESSDELIQILSLETGKTRGEASAEIEKSAFAFQVYAESYKYEFEQKHIQTNYEFSYSQLKSLGVILAIMPWNYPVWQLTRVIAPALLLGNAVLVKPSEITVGTNKIFLNLLRQVLPEDIVQGIIIDHPGVAQLISRQEITAVTMTGSSLSGKKIAQICGQNLKKCILELGGSDAYIVMQDADVELSVNECIQSRLVNYGQSCIAGKRFFISKAIFNDYKTLLLKKISELPERVLAHKKFQYIIQEQVEKLNHAGGKILQGGFIPLGAGAHYPITVIEFTAYHSSIGKEEIFGPVFSLIPFEDEDEVFNFANDCVYGLGAAIFTRRAEEAKNWAQEKLDVGMVSINEQLKSDPRLPFGGVKDSGFGRELSQYGIYEFANIQTVVGRS